LFQGIASSLEEAMNLAQATVNSHAEQVVTAQGELDALRYGRLLQPNKHVRVRGVGHTFDGDYYVNSVSHRIKRGEYKQSFTLARGGVGSSVATVSA
jgi:carotenoid cleavage dioxygenase-like enzyme